MKRHRLSKFFAYRKPAIFSAFTLYAKKIHFALGNFAGLILFEGGGGFDSRRLHHCFIININ
jgi:hypothetical protein